MEYFANFYANNANCLRTPITGTNKAKLIKDIRHIAEANRFEGNECRWSVYYERSDGVYIKVASGGIMPSGYRWRDDTLERI